MTATIKTPDAGIAPENNPFLQGNFAPVEREVELKDLPVSGSIPKELRGRLLRNGSNPVNPGAGYHWFLGDAMLHGILIEDGKARGYQNRWVRTPSLAERTGLPAAPHRGVELVAQGSGNVNVIEHAGRILALPEVGLPYEMTPDLETLGRYDFAGKLTTNMTAHPKIDGKTGELVFFGYDFGDVHLRYHVADASGNLVKTEDINTPLPTMMHDFGVTATRVIFMDFPVVFDLNMVAQGRGLPFSWRDDVGARLGVMPRAGTNDDVVWIDIPPCYVYHPLNAYDDGDLIVFDVVKHDNTFLNGNLTTSNLAPSLERWTIDPRAGRVNMEVVDDRGQEFPRVNPRNECHRHRYGYGVRTNASGDAFGFVDLLKYDMQTGETVAHGLPDNCATSEGVFVPVGDGEDEGYVLSSVYDRDTNTSHIRILDATDFAGPPVATIQLPVRIPFGFHGNFVAG